MMRNRALKLCCFLFQNLSLRGGRRPTRQSTLFSGLLRCARNDAVVCVLLLFVLLGCSENRAPVTHYGVSQGAGSAGAHTILRGDTLWSISKRYKIPMRDIVIENRLAAPFHLTVGQRLKLPPPPEYVVQAGDTLYSVSRLFEVSTSELAQLNNLSSPYTLYKGDILRLPSQAAKQQQVVVAQNNRVEVTPAARAAQKREEQVVVPDKKPQSKEGKKEVLPKITARTPKRSSSKFQSPVEGQVISSYGPKEGGLHNDGINIKAPRGTPVHAAENGVVVYTGNELKGSGNLILVRHDDRWMSAYAHLDKTLIKRGDVIKRGQSIGTVGSTGSVDSPQLHFELRRGTKALNPKVYIEG